MVHVLDWQSESSDAGVRRESIDECRKGSLECMKGQHHNCYSTQTSDTHKLGYLLLVKVRVSQVKLKGCSSSVIKLDITFLR